MARSSRGDDHSLAVGALVQCAEQGAEQLVKQSAAQCVVTATEPKLGSQRWGAREPARLEAGEWAQTGPGLGLVLPPGGMTLVAETRPLGS